MRIVNLKDFLELPKNTVFSFFDTECNEFGTLCLKADNFPPNRDAGLNFWYVELTGSLSVEGNHFDKLYSALEDSTKEFRLDLGTEVNDDLVTASYRFVVYDTKDILQLADRLQQAAFGN